MDDFQSTQRQIDLQIAQLDAEVSLLQSRIAVLEAEKVELRRKRNGSAPIARLPPELLAKVFSSYRTPLSHSELKAFRGYERPYFIHEEDIQDDRAREETNQKLLRPDILALCHVSQGWRDVALCFQALWTHIQVQPRSSESLLRMMWRNAGELPIQLDIAAALPDRLDSDYDSSNFPALILVLGLVQISLGSFKHIGIYTHSRVLLNAMSGRAESLESLVVVEDHVDQMPEERELFSEVLMGGCPNLRHLELMSILIPWSSSLLSSPHMTHLSLDYTLPPTPESIADLLSTVRRLPMLRHLKLHVDVPWEDEEMDFFLSLTTDRSPIELASLEVLDLYWDHRGPLTAFLSLLHIPRDIRSLIINSGNTDHDLAETILNFSKCGQDPDGFVSPEEVAIDFGHASCWREQRFRWQATGDGHGSHKRLVLDQSQAEWRKILVSLPFRPNPTVLRLPWSFSNLRTINIFDLPPSPAGFWRSLSSLKSLEIVRIVADQCQPFLAVLSSTPDETMPNATPMTDSVPQPSVQEPSQVRAFAFPGLRAIWFEAVYCSSPPPQSPSSAAMALVEEVVKAFEKRGSSIPLEEMRFLQCGELTLSGRAFKLLASTTRCLVWEKQAYVRNATACRPKLSA